ncbi:UNVERIFIED_CONTAM: hypothetical protein Sindi_1796200 [Sesamum indicum]
MLTRTLLRRSRSVGVAPLGGNHAGQLPYALRICSPVDSHTSQTPWFVFQDGLNRDPAGQHQECAIVEARRRRPLYAAIGATAFRGYIDCPGFGRRLNSRWSAPRVDRRIGSRRSTSDQGTSPAPIRFSLDNFKHSLTLFSKSFSSLTVLVRYLSLARSRHDGALTLSDAPFQGTWARSAAEDASLDYNSDREAARFSSWAIPGLLVVTRGILGPERLAYLGNRRLLPDASTFAGNGLLASAPKSIPSSRAGALHVGISDFGHPHATDFGVAVSRAARTLGPRDAHFGHSTVLHGRPLSLHRQTTDTQLC